MTPNSSASLKCTAAIMVSNCNNVIEIKILRTKCGEATILSRNAPTAGTPMAMRLAAHP